jgi:DNA-binding Lrp family transcriptional regulator
MDKIDKKILYELLHNSRAPLTHIAKRVRLSRENVYFVHIHENVLFI